MKSLILRQERDGDSEIVYSIILRCDYKLNSHNEVVKFDGAVAPRE